jgi:hypothetical protein
MTFEGGGVGVKNFHEKSLVVHSQKGIIKILLIMGWSFWCTIPVFLLRNWGAVIVSVVLIIFVTLAIMKSKRQIIFNDECVVFRSEFLHVDGMAVRATKILWSDIEKVKYKKRFLGKSMIICYPYNDSVIKEGYLSVGVSYIGYRIAWKEIVLRTAKANPDVEIAAEFREMFLSD